MPPDYSHPCRANICALCYKSNSWQSPTQSYSLANLYSLFTDYLKFINYDIPIVQKQTKWICQYNYVYICTKKLLLENISNLSKKIFSCAGEDPCLGTDNCNLIPTESMFLANIPGYNCETDKSSKGTHPVLWWNFGKILFLPTWHDIESARRVTLSPGN